MRRLSFAGANGGGADDARGVAVRDRRSAAGLGRQRPSLYLSRQRYWRHHPWSCENEAMAQQAAAAYCARWDKYHRITSVHRQYGDFIAFSCLWSPYINPYALPAVPTRSSCYYPSVRPLIINK